MTLLEALTTIRQNLMKVETKGESSIYLVDSIRLLAQIEAIAMPQTDEGKDSEADTVNGEE